MKRSIIATIIAATLVLVSGSPAFAAIIGGEFNRTNGDSSGGSDYVVGVGRNRPPRVA